jgi:hypothetical protein
MREEGFEVAGFEGRDERENEAEVEARSDLGDGAEGNIEEAMAFFVFGLFAISFG